MPLFLPPVPHPSPFSTSRPPERRTPGSWHLAESYVGYFGAVYGNGPGSSAAPSRACVHHSGKLEPHPNLSTHPAFFSCLLLSSEAICRPQLSGLAEFFVESPRTDRDILSYRPSPAQRTQRNLTRPVCFIHCTSCYQLRPRCSDWIALANTAPYVRVRPRCRRLIRFREVC